jgi:hypothetical protein
MNPFVMFMNPIDRKMSVYHTHPAATIGYVSLHTLMKLMLSVHLVRIIQIGNVPIGNRGGMILGINNGIVPVAGMKFEVDLVILVDKLSMVVASGIYSVLEEDVTEKKRDL